MPSTSQALQDQEKGMKITNKMYGLMFFGKWWDTIEKMLKTHKLC